MRGRHRRRQRNGPQNVRTILFGLFIMIVFISINTKRNIKNRYLLMIILYLYIVKMALV